ncbi:putative signal transduction protein [endosymbiont of Tevnia jerichonana (vent Tica)]|jgi:HD-like signal output (HDOD) protein|nr:putative signal transduction protein [endosymbiont of Tevnia jerichonana (vent Tica)]
MDDEIGFHELAHEIERFPTITARLISLANSAWASPRSPVTNLNQACVQLGLQVVRSLSIALAISSPFNPSRCPAFHAERFWCTCMLVGEGAGRLSEQAGARLECDPQTARTAGLLHSLGLLWLADNIPEETAQALSLDEADPTSCVRQALRQTVGDDYCSVGGCLGQAWALPDVLTNAMRYHCDKSYHGTSWQTAALVGSAANMVSRLYRGEDFQAEDPRLKKLEFAESELESVFQKLADQFERTQELAKALFQNN